MSQLILHRCLKSLAGHHDNTTSLTALNYSFSNNLVTKGFIYQVSRYRGGGVWRQEEEAQ